MTLLSLILQISLAWTLVHCGLMQTKPEDATGLDAVIKKMDAAAASFRSTQADFEWDVYEKVIDEVDSVQTGTIYYRRNGKEIEMMADVKESGNDEKSLKPERKNVLFSGGKVKTYEPKPDRLTIYDLGKNAADFESYLVLGFGGSGQDLLKAFDVTYIGAETVQGVKAAKLSLVPKSQRVRNNFNRILLWIDLDRGISVQQQFFDPQQDYRLAKYSNFHVNQPIANGVFQIKTTSKTETVSQGG
jgi:outer membrane lipoprotein-sorting protein